MKSVLRASRRRLSVLLTAVLLASAVMAAVPAGAGARSEHCKAPCRHCQTSSVMTCCGNERSEPSTLPLQASTAPAATHHSLAVPAFDGASFVAVMMAAPALSFSGTPPGHRSLDLPILNSAFLI